MNVRIFIGRLIACTSGIVAAAHAENPTSEAMAPAELAEVVVTAQKTQSPLQSTPVAVAVVQGEDLAQKGVAQLDDALRNLAGVTVSQNPTVGFGVTIRGVGPSLPSNIGGDPGISTNFDGVFNKADIASKIGFYDLARIEVLRGPQGTLYGRNAEGGVLNTVTNNPVADTFGSTNVTVGNYDFRQFTAMGNVSLGNTLALRIAGSSVSRRGFLSNGQDDNVGEGMRGKLLWTPSDSASLLLGAEFARSAGESGGTVAAFGQAPNPSLAYISTNPRNQIYEQSAYKVWAQLDADVGIGELTFLPAYQWLDNPKELQYTGLTKADAPGVSGLAQRSAELRLASKPAWPVQWVAGLYGYNFSQGAARSLSTSIGPGNTVVDNLTSTLNVDTSTGNSSGIFGQASIPVTNALRVIAGARRSTDKKSAYFTNTNSSQSADWSSFDWKGGLEFDLRKDSLLYFTASTGYRPGGISPAPGTSSSVPPTVHDVYGVEKLRSYELGSKNEFFNRTLRVNGSLYYYNYRGFQQSNLILNAAPPPLFLLLIDNLPKVTNKGVELETQYLVSREDVFTASATYLKSDVIDPFLILPQRLQLQGQPLPNSPKWTADATYQHTFHLSDGATLAPQLTARYTDDAYVYIPLTANSIQPAYWYEEASLLFTSASGAWSANLFGRNLSNKVIKSNFVANNLTLNSPRTYGVSVNVTFR